MKRKLFYIASLAALLFAGIAIGALVGIPSLTGFESSAPAKASALTGALKAEPAAFAPAGTGSAHEESRMSSSADNNTVPSASLRATALVCTWTTATDYPATITDNAVTSDGTYAYSIGGYNDLGVTAAVERYNPGSGTWTGLASLPNPLFDASAAYAGVTQKIYVFGGKTPIGSALDTVYVYDIAANSWTAAPTVMPEQRYSASVAYSTGRQTIYVIAGYDSNAFQQSQTWEYDPVNNTWNDATQNMPLPVSGAATSIIGDFIYLVGFSEQILGMVHYRYDTSNDTWDTRAPFPADLFGIAAGAADNTVVVFGGAEVGGTYFAASYVYDPAADSWTNGPNMNIERGYGGGTAVGDLVIAVGGYNSSGILSSVETARISTGNCSTPTPTTPTATITRTPTATPVPGCRVLSLASRTQYPAGVAPFAVATGNFSNDIDSHLDLVVANSGSNNISVLLGNGSGGFGPQRTFAVGGGPHSVAVGYFDDDTFPDLVTANANSNNVSVLLGVGSGIFTTATTFAVGSSPWSVAVGDFNNDGLSDLVTANASSNSVSVLLGNGDGTFQGAINYGTGSAPYSVAVGNFNRDNNVDLVSANGSSNSVSVLLGNGDGTFEPATNYAVGSVPYSVAVGDFNKDRIADLAVANSAFSSNNVSVLLSNGDGTFRGSANYAAGRYPSSVVVGDLNNDHTSDLVTANGGTFDVSVLLGTTQGHFAPDRNFPVGLSAQPYSVAMGDFNEDGRADLVTANYGSNNVSVLLHQCGYGSHLGWSNSTIHMPPASTVTTTMGFAFGALSPASLSSISDLQVVGLTFDHLGAGDLRATLISPGGTRVPLFSNVCGATAWTTDTTGFNLSDDASQPLGAPGTCPPLSDTYRPQGSLSSLIGQDPEGDWTLEVANDSNSNSGTLVDWGLLITDSAPAPTSTPTSTPTATPAPNTVFGHLTWQGIAQPGNRNSGLTATLTLCSNGSPQNYVVSTDASGYFTTTTALPAGTYSWRIKGPKWLANAGSVTLLSGATNQEFGMERAGDLDPSHDNLINAADFNALRAVFGQASSVGDLNNDGLSDATDFNLLRLNFGQAGAATNCP